TEDRAQGGALARAVRPDQSENASGLDLQVDPVQCDGFPVCLAQCARFDDRHDSTPPLRRRLLLRPVAAAGAVEKLLRCQTEPPDGGQYPRPVLAQESFPPVAQQLLAYACPDEHADTPPLLDDLLVGQLLIGFQNGERIDAVIGRRRTDRWQRIAFTDLTVENHGHDSIPQLAVDRLAVIPLLAHA